MFCIVICTILILVVSTVAAFAWTRLISKEDDRPKCYWCPRDCYYMVHLKGSQTAHPRCPIHHCDLVGE